MRESTERDLAVAESRLEMANARIGELVSREEIATEIECMFGPHDRRFQIAIEIADRVRATQPGKVK